MSSKASRPTPQKEWLNKTDMAKSLGISVQAFDKWGVAPVARIGRENFYTVRAVLDNRMEHRDEMQQPDQVYEPGTLDYERLRLTKAQADNIELKNQIAKGKIAPIEVITTVLSKVAGEATGELDAVPLNIRRKHPQLDSQLIEDIKRHCVKAQNAIARLDDVMEQVLSDYLADADPA